MKLSSILTVFNLLFVLAVYTLAAFMWGRSSVTQHVRVISTAGVGTSPVFIGTPEVVRGEDGKVIRISYCAEQYK